MQQNISHISLPANSQGHKNDLNLSGSFEITPFKQTLTALIASERTKYQRSLEKTGPPVNAAKLANKHTRTQDASLDFSKLLSPAKACQKYIESENIIFEQNSN